MTSSLLKVCLRNKVVSKILETKRTERVTNESALTGVKEKREVWLSVEARRDKMIGRILRHDSLKKNDIEGDVVGNVSRGRLI